MGRFDGRVAIVTGSARGIGAGIARRFADEGASVAILDLNEEQAAATAAEIAAGLSGDAKAIGVGCNVSDAASVEAADRGRSRGAIRAKVTDWIAASEHAGDIAAIRTAHRRPGGPGALYLILKRRR